MSNIRRSIDKYPLTQQLQQLFKSRAKTVSLHRPEIAPATLDIVSPELCDDVLNYLKPTLEQYKGCDIIDLHPGACLWSQKVHDYLKPRRHLLMEPEDKYFKPFIKPLLDQKNSAYRHTRLSGAHPRSYWSTYDLIFNDELLPKRKPLETNDPRLREPNTTLLVIGSLHRRYKFNNRLSNRVHYTNMILSQFAFSSQNNTMFHAYGLVRMLLWLPQDIQHLVMPRGLSGRTGLNMAMDVAVDMAEVAAPAELLKTSRLKKTRQDRIVAASAEKTLDRMENSHFSLPPHRRMADHQAAIDRKASGVPKTKGHGWGPQIDAPLSLQALRTEIELLQEDIITTMEFVREYRDVNGRSLSKNRKTGKVIAENTEYEFTDQITNPLKPREKYIIGPYVDQCGRLIRAERELGRHEASLTQDEMNSLKQTLVACSRSLGEMTKYYSNYLNNRVIDMTEDEMGFLADPPLAAIDRRPFEPLKVDIEECWPQFPMFLLDMNPTKKNLASDITSADEGTTVMRELASAVFNRYRDPLPKALDHLAPNAGQDLIRDTPMLTDPKFGGKLNPNDMTPRLMSREMFMALVTSYLEWPFRPSITELEAEAEANQSPSSDDAEEAPDEADDS